MRNRREGGVNEGDEPLSFADEIRQRRATQRMLASDDGGAPFLFFNRLDLLLLALLCLGIWFIVKMNHKVDLAAELWELIKPNYDKGHWDEQ